MPTLGLERSGYTTFRKCAQIAASSLEVGASCGNEAGLADSGRKGEISARVGGGEKSDLVEHPHLILAVQPQTWLTALANVLNLGHTASVKSITFHPKALAFIRSQSPTIKREVGEALRDVQKGISLGLPLSRPMPTVASGVHELRVRSTTTIVRVFYFVKVTDTIVVFHGFQKKTQKTPTQEIAVGQQRLQEVLHGHV